MCFQCPIFPTFNTIRKLFKNHPRISPSYSFICSETMANVVELKVNLHCDECIRKILKAIKKIEDIETYNVDTQLNKVTVTGNAGTEEVTRVLQKIGKTAYPWEEDEHTPFTS